MGQNHESGMTLYVRASDTPASLIASVRRRDLAAEHLSRRARGSLDRLQGSLNHQRLGRAIGEHISLKPRGSDDRRATGESRRELELACHQMLFERRRHA